MGALAQRFTIEREAGVGGMGKVYRAVDSVDGQTVALKVLTQTDPSSVERFSREAEVLARMQHPAIVRYVDHGVTADGERFIAMEWLEGVSLAFRLARDPPTLTDSLLIVRQLADALAEAHRAGIVHRDIKPSNVFLVEGSPARVKLLDFGIARRVFGDLEITATGMLVGSWAFMAPEQAMGSKDVDARVDVFALGCVLYECISGRRAFRAENPTAVLAKILLYVPPPLADICPGVSRELSDLVNRMLSKRAESRPENGAEVSLALSGLLKTHGDSVDKPSPEPSAITSSEQRVVWTILVANVADPDATRVTERGEKSDVGGLRALVEAYGGRLDFLVNRTAIATFSAKGNPVDEAPRAARCALEMSAMVPESPMSLAVGLAVVSGESTPLGNVLDVGTAALQDSAPAVVRLTPDSASTLGQRFDIQWDDHGPYLVGENEAKDGTVRRLLGHVTTCVGRERELAMLEAVFAECVGDPIARAILLTGAAGSGKSRLRYELLRRLSQKSSEPLVLIGRADPVGAGSPFATLAQSLRRWAQVHRDDTADVQRQKLTEALHPAFGKDPAKLGQVVPLFGELCGIASDGASGGRARVAGADMRVMGDAMQAAFEDWLTAECARHPVVLVLEDLQWGDVPTTRFVGSALRHLHDAPFMVLALGRPEVKERFPDLWKERHPIQMELGPLTPKASEKLAREVLGADVPASVVQNVVERAEGNAFYLEELIRAVAEKQTAIPDSVLAMVQARLDKLGPEARRVLRAASIFGPRFSREGIVALLGGAERAGEAKEQLDFLAAKEIVQSSNTGTAGDLVFCHALLHEATYAMLTEDDRRLGHRLAGEYLEGVKDADAARLAEHFVRGGVPERAARWFCRATEQALEGSDLTAALALGARALESAEDAQVRSAVGSMLAEAHRWRGEYGPARHCAAAALEQAVPYSADWFVAAEELIVASANHGNMEAALPYLREAALASVEGAAARTGQISCVLRGCLYLVEIGNFDEADSLSKRVEPPEDELHLLAPAALARVYSLRAARALHIGDNGGSIPDLEAAIECYESAGQSRMTCMLRTNLGAVYAELGQLDRASQVLTQVLGTADRLGAARVKSFAHLNYAEALAGGGLRSQAWEHASLAAGLGKEHQDPRVEGASRTILSTVALANGDVETALVEAEASVALLAEQPLMLPIALTRYADVLLRVGRTEEARVKADAAMAIVDEHGGVEHREATVRLIHYRVLVAAGEHARAREAIVAARDRLLSRAARITSPDLREAFLTRLYENAETLRLATASIPPP